MNNQPIHSSAPVAGVFRCLRDRVLVELEPPRVSAGGLLLESEAEADHRGMREARVIAAGPNAHDLKPGDRVLVRGNSPGWPAPDGQVGLWIDDVYGVIAEGVRIDSD